MWFSKYFAVLTVLLMFKVSASPIAQNRVGNEVLQTLAERSTELNKGLNMLAALSMFSSNDDCHKLQSILTEVQNSVTSAYGQATDLATVLNQVFDTVRNGCLSTNIINGTVCLTGQAVVVKNVYVQDIDSYFSTATNLTTSVKALGQAFMGCLQSL